MKPAYPTNSKSLINAIINKAATTNLKNVFMALK